MKSLLLSKTFLMLLSLIYFGLLCLLFLALHETATPTCKTFLLWLVCQVRSKSSCRVLLGLLINFR